MAKPRNPNEDLVQELCRKSFLADFVYRSPKFRKQSRKQLEAGDLLLPLGRNLVAIQVRARNVNEKFDPTSEVQLRRIQRLIADAVNQVKTAKRGLESGTLRELKNLRGVRVPVHATTYDQHVGVVVLDFNTPTQTSADLDLSIANGLSKVRDIPVHVFLRSDFETIISEVNTLPDFLHYLKTRAALIRSRRLFPLTQELDLLGIYQTQYPLVEKMLAGKADVVMIEPGYWESHRKHDKKMIESRDERRRAGKVVDGLIERVHECIGYVDPELEGDEDVEPGTPESYRMIAEELASLNRGQRNDFGERMFEKAQRADRDPKGFSYYAFTASFGTVFLFLASREPRKQMRRKLSNLTRAIYVRMTDAGLAKRALGIGTQNFSAPMNAQDFCYLPEGLEFDDHDALAKLADKVFGPITHVESNEYGAIEKEKPT